MSQQMNQTPTPTTQSSSSEPQSVQGVTSKYAVQRGALKFDTPSPRILAVHQKAGEKVWLKIGCMIAYDGNYSFTRESIFEQGLMRTLKEGITGEGMTLIKANCKESGTVYAADQGKQVITLFLRPGESVVVNGDDVLCFEDSIKWDVKFIRSAAGFLQGGLFSVTLAGPGFISVTTHFDPLVLYPKPGRPIYTDPQNTVMWSSSLVPSIKTDIKVKSLFTGGSEEEFQMKFDGSGFVMVQSVIEEAPTKQQK